MSAAASPASLPRTPSSTRRQHTYAPPATDRQQYSPTTSGQADIPTPPRRSLSQSQPAQSSHTRTVSSGKPQLINIAKRDNEQTNVAKIPSSSRRSNSRDPPGPSRTDSTRNTTSSSRHGHSRQTSDVPIATMPATNGAAADGMSRQTTSTTNTTARRRTTIDATTGHWELGKTIGAGSMGKVKLARNKETHETVAVKIVPRQSTDEHRTQQEKERADHSKEVRTAREAAIVTLVDHPYICGMRDVVRTNYHWYMLFEYVNGGQMLDYIISHGRLKEKQARKFGRQIASALDYCHRNSIVHRDLKIENILISKTGDIKIIDFGLSNTFSPKSQLKTFCGSLYFAAPELLQAKAYTGPEVDVWSFGIVLYVLVCGKVPFDDQSMPQLHAKIKKGLVEYPPWLGAECRALIGRMLVTDPAQRATLAEIMNHPWMVKGFGGPPENYLLPRKPLQLPLDPEVVRKMTGFDFGPFDDIESQLTKILESEDYQRAVKIAERRTNLPTPEIERKRGVFDFYKRRNSTTSRDTLTNSSSEAVQLGADPINAFSPLISIYYLAKEKIDREHKESNPGALSMPKTPGERPLQLPDLPAPAAAYTNSSSYEMAGETPTGGRSRPRARTHGEDEVINQMGNVRINDPAVPAAPTVIVPPAEQTPTRKESTAAGLLRRFSTRRHKESGNERTSHAPPPSVAISAPNDTSSVPRKSFGVRRTREPSSAGLSPEDATKQRPELLSPSPPNEAASRRIGLGRSTSVNSADFRQRVGRRGASEGSSMREPRTPQPNRRTSRDESGRIGTGDATSDVEPAPRTAPQASRTKSLGHARKDSIQARRAQRAAVQTANVPEETAAQLAEQEERDEQEDFEAGNASAGGGSPSGMKPVFLKGLFSVSTTSSKPFKVIESDIVRVLKQLGVEYTQNGKGGFRCKHSPSIDLAKNQDESPQLPPTPRMTHRRKISFGGLMGNDRDKDRDEIQRTPNSMRDNRRAAENSYTNSEESEADDSADPSDQMRRKPSSSVNRTAGETSTHVQSDLGANMVLRFEIFVVKVPLLSLHGIQFKKVDGGTWQYKNMAQTILNELRL